ncbi:uncharacterized protein LOC112571349 [Pomacea canaliculata]|uniref:uncharacterized protein LOC112571349 n=1 Tax=Pomacea canaliculata TaxID=400727 RepID=UPI000D73FB34|nr:uncharacterized protein LOC112571349 [Pomacea canaliculata]
MTRLLQSLTLAFLVVAIHGVRAAQRVDANVHLHDALLKRQPRMADMTSDMSSQQRTTPTWLPMTELDDVMTLGPNSALKVTSSATTVQGTHVLRLQEFFKGEPVNDAVLTVLTDSTEQYVYDASGTLYRDIENDTDGTRNIDNETALSICLTFNEAIRDDISDVTIEPQIFHDSQNTAYPGYLVQYLVLVESEQRRPVCIVDARDGRITTSWDALSKLIGCVGKGTGGNRKIGRIHYGELHKCLDVHRVNNTCYTENKYVKVIDNKGLLNKRRTHFYNISDAASYDCEEATDQINGAYSPILDALFYGTTVGRMFEDWYNTSPLDGQITIRVHVGVNYSNALWSGREILFGDGDENFHPYVSIESVAHEIGHGVTEKASNLLYYNQWGAINEAFSDMMGETSEAYLSKADWIVASEITKKGYPPVRYFENPSADNHSISHVDNFTDDLSVHYGSGVYRRVFYLLVHEYEQSIKEIFGVFLLANRMYWHHTSDYHSAACDVMKAAYDLGQDGALFRRAFKEVGIDVCDIQNHIMGLRESKVYDGITVARNESPTFLYKFPLHMIDTGVNVSASSSTGDVHIFLTNKRWDIDDEDQQVLAEGTNLVTAQIQSNLTALPLYITLANELKVTLYNVTLRAHAFWTYN